MDSGLAVVLGAVIALAGSSLIPWLRESIDERRTRGERRSRERDEALVEFLAKNAAFGMATTLSETARAATAFEERARAATRLLLLSDGASERRAFADLVNRSVPLSGGRGDSGAAGRALAVLQDVLIRWSVGEVPTADLPRLYDELMAERAPKPPGAGRSV